MYELNGRFRPGSCDSEQDWDNEEREECNIDSKCCQGFVKEKFTIRATEQRFIETHLI